MAGLNVEKFFRQARRAMVYDPVTRIPIGYIRSLSDCKLDDKVSWDDLKVAGELKDTAVKERDMSVSFTTNNYDSKLLVLFANGVLTTLAGAGATGAVEGSENVLGTSVIKATTGCSVALLAGGVADLKEGEYVLKAKTANTLSMYVMSDLHLADGADMAYLDDTYLVMDDISVSLGASTNLTGWGIKIVGGSSATAFVIGDTSHFYVRRANSSGDQIEVGENQDFPDVGMIFYPADHNAEYAFIDVYRIKIAGVPVELKDTWSGYTITASVLKTNSLKYYKIYRNKV